MSDCPRELAAAMMRAMTDDWPFGDLTPLGYGVIVADPPWRWEAWSEPA